MPADTQTAQAYLRTQVLTASPERLRLLLLEGAIRFVTQGGDGLTRKDYSASYEGFSQARGIVIELLNSVRPDVAPELCARVQSLYTFIYQTIIEASMEKDPAKAAKALQLLEFERETWLLAMDRLAAERGNGPAQPAFVSAAAPAARRPLSVQG